MYRIVKDGTTLGLTEQPNFVEPLENGSWGLCGESRAHGIVWEGKVYGLVGKSATEDLELVTLAFVDAGALAVEAVAVQSILFVNAAESGAVDDTTANEHVDLFAAWAYPITYKTGNIRKYGSQLYRCLQDHTSQADWTPDAASSLWKATADPAEEWPAWSQPQGAHDAYAKGAKVLHSGKRWTSDVDNNVWEPGVYGWTEVTE